MELLVVADKANSQISRQHLIKILNYVETFSDCFSTIHVLSAFDQVQVEKIELPSNMVIHPMNWRETSGNARLARHLAYLWQLFWIGWKLIKQHPTIKMITHPFGHYLAGLIVILLARSTGRQALIRVTGDRQSSTLSLRRRHGWIIATILDSLLFWLEKFVLWQADRIIAISPHFLDEYSQFAAKTAIIPSLFPILDRYCVQAPLTEPGSAPIPSPVKAVFVGRLEPVKGLEMLVRAIAEVPQICCQIVGGGQLRSTLEQQVQTLGLAERVTFCGPQPQERVFELMEHSDVLLLPSLNEYMGNVLIEAAALGRPAIASDVGGVKYIVKHGQTGLLCRPGDVESLRQQLEYFAQRRELWAQWGYNAQDFVCQTYSTHVLKAKGRTFIQAL